jgi:hypothetical protein
LVCGQLFSSLFFFDFHRTNFSDSAGPFTSFDPVGFAIFANLRQLRWKGQPPPPPSQKFALGGYPIAQLLPAPEDCLVRDFGVGLATLWRRGDQLRVSMMMRAGCTRCRPLPYLAVAVWPTTGDMEFLPLRGAPQTTVVPFGMKPSTK